MPRFMWALFLLGACAGGVLAPDLEQIQIHGFATQGFLFSSANNYLTMKTSEGSLAGRGGGGRGTRRAVTGAAPGDRIDDLRNSHLCFR